MQRPDKAESQLPPGTRMSSVFEEMGNALLILGAPGSGKTTLLLELTNDLLNSAEKDSSFKLPVVFHLSSWAIKQRPLQDWLSDQLNEHYKVHPHHARSWVARGLIIPLLDGLDEVATEYRSACAEAINMFRKEHGFISMAVCSRKADYEALTTKLHLQGALVVQPLTREQTNRYLVQAGTPLAGLRAALENDEIMWELLDNPLMLSFATLAYKGLSTTEVRVTGTLAERKTSLFTAYADAMFERRGEALLYTPQQTIRWLARLAFVMNVHKQSELLLEQMQPSWLSSIWLQKVMDLGVMFLCGISGVLLCAPLALFALISLPSDGIHDPIIFVDLVLITGISFAAMGWFITLLKKNEIHPVTTLRWDWSASRKWSFGSAKALFWGASLGYIFLGPFIIVVFDTHDAEYATSSGMLVGIVSGVIINLLRGAVVLGDITKPLTPNEGIRRSIRNAIIFGLSSMLLFTVIAFPFRNIYFSSFTSIEFLNVVLIIGLYFGAFVGQLCGGVAAFQHLTLRFLLWLDGFAPWRYVQFLDYATERVFLRKMGGRYIFIHRLLLEYFASLPLVGKEASNSRKQSNSSLD